MRAESLAAIFFWLPLLCYNDAIYNTSLDSHPRLSSFMAAPETDPKVYLCILHF